jgi:thioredoxin reductase (NADPH)
MAEGTASPTGSTTTGLANAGLATDGVENLVIVGSGPAGYTAAIYAARANLASPTASSALS